MDIIDQTASDLTTAVHGGSLSPHDIAESMILEVERTNPLLNAIIRFDPALIRSEAARVEKLLASGATVPLAGMPFTVKDNIWVKGQVASQGSLLFKDFIAPRDALCVERLRAHGAMVLGATNSSEFACKGITTNKLFGATRNPWDPQRTPGGSSGGAASAVCAGLGAVALGTDAGGSVRRPAAHTGVIGMKPTQGRIPHPVGFLEPVFGQSTIGIMARTTADLILSLNAMTGHDGRDVMSVPCSQSTHQKLNGIRVAYSPRLGLGFPVDKDVQSAVSGTVQLLEQFGCHVEQVDPAWPDGVDEAALMPLQFAGLAALYGDTWKKTPALFDPDIGSQIEQGLCMTAATVAKALFLREELARVLAEFQTTYRMLVTPTTPCVAWLIDQLGPPVIEGREVSSRAHAVFTPIFNHTFVPACSVPCNATANGLPIGLQIVGRRFEDELVIAAAAAIEQAIGADWSKPRRINLNQ